MNEETVVEMARRRGLKDVAVINFELLRVAFGHPMIVTTIDGEEVCLRLATPDEVLEKHRRVCAALGVEPTMTYAQAHDSVIPLPV